MAAKLRTLEFSQMTRDEELNKIKEQICVGKTTQTMLRGDTNKPLVPSPPESVPGQITQPTSNLHAVTLQDTRGAWSHPFSDDGDELWASLEKIDQLARKNKADEQQPFLPRSPTPSGDKPRIRASPYHGVSLWDDYRTQFELVAELNHWDNRTKAIYLAASQQGPARATLGDLDPSKRKEFSALIEALGSGFAPNIKPRCTGLSFAVVQGNVMKHCSNWPRRSNASPVRRTHMPHPAYKIPW